MNNIRIKQIELYKAEGIVKRAVTYSFDEANKLLVRWANGPDVPNSGYDKTDFKVVFSNGDYEYKGTFDLKKKHIHCANVPLLQNQMIHVIKEAYGLLPVKKHPFPEYYIKERSKISAEDRQEALDYLEKVDFEGADIGGIEIIAL